MRKTSEHTTILEKNHVRKIFASHGLHLNGHRKEMLDKQITSSIYTILEKPVTLPISLGWKTKKNVGTNILNYKQFGRPHKCENC
jgi:hypothetical protein